MENIKHTTAKTLLKKWAIYPVIATSLLTADTYKGDKGLEKIANEQVSIAKEIKGADQRYDEEIKIEQKRNEDSIYTYIHLAFKKVNPPEHITKDYVRAIIYTESTDNPNALSKKGARGHMQLMPKTWEDREPNLNFYAKAFHPETNIEVGTKHLKWINAYCQKKHPDWDTLSNEQKRDLIAAAYNSGQGRLKKKNWDIKKMPKETKDYIEKVKNYLIESES